MFESLASKFSGAFSSLRAKGKISAGDVETVCSQIRTALLDSDVAVEVVDKFIVEIRQKSLDALPAMQSGSNQANAIFEIVNQELIEILGGATRRIRMAKNPPTVIMLAGLQGAGKTTLAGKLAKYFSDQGDTPLLVAADLQRPNAVTQLQVVGQSIDIPVFAPEVGNGIGDPVAVAKAGVDHAKSKLHNFVIIDTAGRLGVDEELMNQASKIRDAVNPNEILFVVDSMIGQDAVPTAQAFLNGVGFDGVVLTKLDGDARGGAALSIASLTKRPIMFASTGEKMQDFDVFYPERMASRILGLGDIATLAEQAKKAFDSQSSAKLEEKFVRGEEFTFDDFLEQLQAMSKMGNMSKLLGMLPGAGAMKKQIENFDESEIVRSRAIVESMTPLERSNPKVLNGSRRARIARGSGRNVSDVNNLVDRFAAAQKLMKQVRSSGMPPGISAGLPAGMNASGMPAMPAGFGGASKGKPNAKKKSKSGNPAKRALEEG